MDLQTINNLMNSLKRLVEVEDDIMIPKHGYQTQLNVKDYSNYFFIDIQRKGIRLPKFTLQLRESIHRDSPLLRLDILGPPHKNPEGDFPFSNEIIPCPHIHIAHPEYGDRVAYPLNNNYANLYLSDVEILDLIYVLRCFLELCNIGNINDYNYSLQEELF